MARAAAKAKPIDNVQGEITKLKTVNNTLKVRIDDLKTFQPLTDNQKIFFDAYKRGDYFIALPLVL